MALYNEYGYDIKDGVGIIPEWETEIKEGAFNRSRVKSINFPHWVKIIGKKAFCSCVELTDINLPEWVEEIEEKAFMDCKSLKIISLPRWVRKIGNYAFQRCSSLTHLTITSLVTEIGNNAFSHCSSLTSIVVSKDNKVYDSREDCNAIIHTESNTLVRGCENTIIPPSVTKIEDWAFDGCSNLTSINIPSSVTKIGNSAFSVCI